MPTYKFIVQCYHYETTGHGKNRNTRRINTHRAEGLCMFSNWEDLSLDPSHLEHVKQEKLCRLRLKKDFAFTSGTKK